MTDESMSSDASAGVEEAVEAAQQLEGHKRAVLQELQDRGEDMEGARVIVAHQVGDQAAVTDVSS